MPIPAASRPQKLKVSAPSDNKQSHFILHQRPLNTASGHLSGELGALVFQVDIAEAETEYRAHLRPTAKAKQVLLAITMTTPGDRHIFQAPLSHTKSRRPSFCSKKGSKHLEEFCRVTANSQIYNWASKGPGPKIICCVSMT